MKFHVYSTNCDCASGHVVRRNLGNWKYGPKCPYCKTILGIMQWSYIGRGEGKTFDEIVECALKEEMKKELKRRQHIKEGK